MSSKSIKMNDFSTGNQLERFFRFAVSNLHAFCSIRFCQIRSKKNDDFDEITPFFVLFLSKYLIFDEIVLLAFFIFF